MELRAKVGDEVICVDASVSGGTLELNRIYTVVQEKENTIVVKEGGLFWPKYYFKDREKQGGNMGINDDIENRFTYHSPKPGQPKLYEEIRDTAKLLAYKIEDECPASREKSLALTRLEEAVMWANAAIARN